ncbi:IS1595 family transposase [Rhodoblastus sp.]|uniref:IS1595 family transposase n=1 Tax=Rhodoblastus sp. TaxID=1962975 RepID=UPI00262AA32E|nr:IS1595 family transposase [Rhodoblastus sp.]
MSALSNPIFQDETAAREWLETRVWKDGRKCPHCGVIDQSTLMKGESHRAGLYQCNACRKPFTVTVGTLYESSKIPLHTWLAVTHLMMSSKKGMSALQISRMIDRPYKTVWFMCHRIRESLKASPDLAPMGGQNKVVEADETYVGGKAKNRAHREPAPKQAVFSLVERDGNVRSFHIATVSSKTLRPIINENVCKSSALMTDESAIYPKIGAAFSLHGTVNHSANEYARAYFWHTNSVEGYFSLLKRAVFGTFHHVSEAHLHRYTAEQDFKFNTRKMTDFERTTLSLDGIFGKRLTYRRAGEARAN